MGSMLVEGNQWLKALDYDLGSRSIRGLKIGAGGGNRTHGLGIMRPSLFH